jgi:hypothetical protein
MITPRFFVRLTLPAVLAIAATACATQTSSEDHAMERAYKISAPVTGSRIARRVDPQTGAPVVGYAIETIKGRDEVRAALRDAATPIDNR